MRRGFTLMEVLVSVAIVAIVAAITMPIVAKAKESAYKAKSVSNMRQVHMAIELYAQAHDGAPSGTLEQMGLPPWPTAEYLGDSVKDLHPPFRPYEGWDGYMYMPIPAEFDRRWLTWQEYTAMVGPNAVVICDPFFNPRSSDDFEMYWQDPFVRKYVMGMTISGTLVKRTKSGSLNLTWWLD